MPAASSQGSRSGPPGRDQGAGTSTRGSLGRRGGTSSRGKPAATAPEARHNALFLLEAASADLGGDKYAEFVNLPFLPLVDGSLGRFLPPPIDGDEMVPGSRGGRAERAVFVCSMAERRLLTGDDLGGAGSGAGKRLLEDLETLTPSAKRLLSDKRLHQATNVTMMEPRDLVGMLATVFPEAWKGLKQVAWAPGSRDVSAASLQWRHVMVNNINRR